MRTREERRRKLSEYGRKGAEARWSQYHAAAPAPDYHELPETCVTIQATNHLSGKVTTMVFHPGTRRGRFRIDVDGTFWRECGWSEAMVKIRKSFKRTPLYVQ